MEKNHNMAFIAVTVSLMAVALEYIVHIKQFFPIFEHSMLSEKIYMGILKAKNSLRLIYIIFFTVFALSAQGQLKSMFSKYFKGKATRDNKQITWMGYLAFSMIVYFFRFLTTDYWTYLILFPVVLIIHFLFGLAIGSFQKSPKKKGNKDEEEFGIKNNPELIEIEDYEKNKYSFNWKIKYRSKPYYINLLNPFRGIQIYGSPGSGKSYGVVENIIETVVRKGFTGILYDFKMPTLSTYLMKSFYRFKKPGDKRKIWLFDLYNPRRSHRINPIAAHTMHDSTDAENHAQTILLNLNRSWIGKDGDFWASNATALFKAVIWYLKTKQPEYCTLPHAVAILNADPKLGGMETLLNMLCEEPECARIALPIVEAYRNQAEQQLAGVAASVQLPLGKLISPEVFWALSASEFSLDLNNKDTPGFLCLGNNTVKQDVFGPILSLVAQVCLKNLNQKGKLPSAAIFDEFPTMYLKNFQVYPATARSNFVSIIIALQDISQMTEMYGEKASNSIVGTLANTFVGQMTEISTARKVQDMIGKAEKTETSTSTSSSGGQTTESESTSKREKLLMPAEELLKFNKGELTGVLAEGEKEYSQFHGTPVLKKDDTPYPIHPVKQFGDGKLPEELVYEHLDHQQVLAFNQAIFDEPAPVPTKYLRRLVIDEYEKKACVLNKENKEAKLLEEFVDLVNYALPKKDASAPDIYLEDILESITYRTKKKRVQTQAKLDASRIWALNQDFLKFFRALIKAEKVEFEAMQETIQLNYKQIIQEAEEMLSRYQVKGEEEKEPQAQEATENANTYNPTQTPTKEQQATPVFSDSDESIFEEEDDEDGVAEEDLIDEF